MRCAVLCCAVLCCAVLCCAVCCAVLCCAVLCCAVLCCDVLCGAVWCCAVLCCAVPSVFVLRLLCYAVTVLLCNGLCCVMLSWTEPARPCCVVWRCDVHALTICCASTYVRVFASLCVLASCSLFSFPFLVVYYVLSCTETSMTFFRTHLVVASWPKFLLCK